MKGEPDVIPYDATLLGSVLDQHPTACPKTLAARCGRDVSTVYRYLSGEKTIPSDVLRSAFELTGDFRILAYLAGAVPIRILPLGDSPAGPLPPISELLPRACASVKEAASGVEYMGRIVADGKVSPTDAPDIERFRETAARCQRDLSLLVAALAAHSKGALA